VQSSESKYLPALRFHWLTPYYDNIASLTLPERRFKQALITQAQLEQGHRVLDLASGTGTLSIWIKQRQPQVEVIGVDCDPAILTLAIEKAEKANTSVQFDRAMSNCLPYPAEHFDRVFSSLFFHHLSWEVKEQTAKELFRVLKPGAELHVADWGRASNIMMRCLFFFEQLFDGFDSTQDNISGKLVTLFEQSGFAEVTQEHSFDTIFGTLALYKAIKPS
jgi:ubiquinone/menaquinone biosynthesis C-methylase UbiE